MVLDAIKQGFRSMTAPIVYVASGFDGEVTINYVRGSNNDSSSSIITTDDEGFRKMKEKFDAANQENDEKMGQLLDEIRELKKNPKENRKEIDKKFREIHRGIEERNRKMTEQIAQKIDKLEETKNEIAAEIKDAVEKGDMVRANALKAKLSEVNNKVAGNNLEKNNFVKKSEIQELKREIEKPFLRRVRWSNPFN
jgi:methyl-accepting chemotaxis protein